MTGIENLVHQTDRNLRALDVSDCMIACRPFRDLLMSKDEVVALNSYYIL